MPAMKDNKILQKATALLILAYQNPFAYLPGGSKKPRPPGEVAA